MLVALGRLREKAHEFRASSIHQDPVSENKILLHPETQFCRGGEQSEGKVNVLPLSRVTSFVYFHLQ